MNIEEIKIIAEIVFRDINVNVYFHPDNRYNVDSAVCAWQIRNTESCYRGIVYMNNETGKFSYPEDAIIPEQTVKDKEMIPKFIIVGKQVLSDDDIKIISKYLESEYLRKNKLNNI